jgi:hypothetical protein
MGIVSRCARRPWLVGGELSYRIEVPAATAVRVSTGAGAAVDAGSYAGRTQIDVVNDPAAPHRLVAHSNAGQVRVHRR